MAASLQHLPPEAREWQESAIQNLCIVYPALSPRNALIKSPPSRDNEVSLQSLFLSTQQSWSKLQKTAYCVCAPVGTVTLKLKKITKM